MESDKTIQTLGMKYSIEYSRTNMNILLDDPNCTLENILKHEYILDEIKYNDRLNLLSNKIVSIKGKYLK